MNVIEIPERNGTMLVNIIFDVLDGISSILTTVYNFLFQEIEIKFSLLNIDLINITIIPWQAILFGGTALILGLMIYSILKP